MTVLMLLAVAEVFSSASLLYIYRFHYAFDTQPVLSKEVSSSSTVNMVNLVSTRVGFNFFPLKYIQKYEPEHFFTSDSVLGYTVLPGKYTHTFFRRNKFSEGKLESFKTKITIQENGLRWTGKSPSRHLPKIYIFGDSCIFGRGLNDEQTFSYLLQSELPGYEVKLYALDGYSLKEAYLNFKVLEKSITPSDIIVLAYGDFFDRRHVLSPGYLRATNEITHRVESGSHDIFDQKFPRASLDQDGIIKIDYINADCRLNHGYCKAPEPDGSEMTKVTAAIINYFPNHTKAAVYFLHFMGKPDNPVLKLIDKRITAISALPEDFDHFIMDKIEGFDSHPGPYWHYEISRKLLQELKL